MKKILLILLIALIFVLVTIWIWLELNPTQSTIKENVISESGYELEYIKQHSTYFIIEPEMLSEGLPKPIIIEQYFDADILLNDIREDKEKEAIRIELKFKNKLNKDRGIMLIPYVIGDSGEFFTKLNQWEITTMVGKPLENFIEEVEEEVGGNTVTLWIKKKEIEKYSKPIRVTYNHVQEYFYHKK